MNNLDLLPLLHNRRLAWVHATGRDPVRILMTDKQHFLYARELEIKLPLGSFIPYTDWRGIPIDRVREREAPAFRRAFWRNGATVLSVAEWAPESDRRLVERVGDAVATIADFVPCHQDFSTSTRGEDQLTHSLVLYVDADDLVVPVVADRLEDLGNPWADVLRVANEATVGPWTVRRFTPPAELDMKVRTKGFGHLLSDFMRYKVAFTLIPKTQGAEFAIVERFPAAWRLERGFRTRTAFRLP